MHVIIYVKLSESESITKFIIFAEFFFFFIFLERIKISHIFHKEKIRDIVESKQLNKTRQISFSRNFIRLIIMKQILFTGSNDIHILFFSYVFVKEIEEWGNFLAQFVAFQPFVIVISKPQSSFYNGLL